MALSSISVDLINKASPINNEYSIGNRLKYNTSAGAFSSGTLVQPTMSAVTLNSMTMQSPVSTIDSTALTTDLQIQGSYNAYRASGGACVRVTSSLASGARVTITNLSTVATGQIALDTGGAGIGLNMGSFGATGGSSANFLTLAALQTVDLVLTSGMWYAIGGTGTLATFSTVRTGS